MIACGSLNWTMWPLSSTTTWVALEDNPKSGAALQAAPVELLFVVGSRGPRLMTINGTSPSVPKPPGSRIAGGTFSSAAISSAIVKYREVRRYNAELVSGIRWHAFNDIAVSGKQLYAKT
jgi:hypothetical protein